MTLQKYKDVNQAIALLSQRGYNLQFSLRSLGLYSRGTNRYYQQKDLTIDELYRFRNPKESAFDTILFASTCVDGSKGIIKSPGGDTPDLNLLSFMDKVKIKEWQNMS